RVIPLNKNFTIWEILASYRLSLRNIEITASTYIDGGVCCLSGRTAAYRTLILRDPDFQTKFANEYWLGKYHCHSGDDKFLTRWLHSHEWKTYIQACPEAELASTFKDNWRFLKQLLRWTRNTWRSDLKSLIVERKIWRRYPFVAFSMLDKFFNPISLLAGPITVGYLCSMPNGYLPTWVVLTSYFIWLILTRLIKYIPHFINRPQDVFTLPIWIVFNIYFALLKIYCLFTLHIVDWGTRVGADDQGEKEEDDSEIFLVKNEIVDKSKKINLKSEEDEIKKITEKEKVKTKELKKEKILRLNREMDIERGLNNAIEIEEKLILNSNYVDNSTHLSLSRSKTSIQVNDKIVENGKK
ncbi:hypothetical protein HK099_003844, partial [Clydaea vesicula]